MAKRKVDSSSPTPDPTAETLSMPTLKTVLANPEAFKSNFPLTVMHDDRQYVCQLAGRVQANLVARLTVNSPRFEKSLKAALLDLQAANLDAVFVDHICITLGK